MKHLLKKIWWCYIWRWHKWTDNFERRGNKIPDMDYSKLSNAEIHKMFLDDCTMYCDRCGKFSSVSLDYQHHMREQFGISDDFEKLERQA